MKKEENELILLGCLKNLLIALVFLIFLVGLMYPIIQPYFEMKAFNKFSIKKATYWDALFSELRIINNEEGENK